MKNFEAPKPIVETQVKTKEQAQEFGEKALKVFKRNTEGNNNRITTNSRVEEIKKNIDLPTESASKNNEIQEKYSTVLEVYKNSQEKNQSGKNNKANTAAETIWRENLEKLIVRPDNFPEKILKDAIKKAKKIKPMTNGDKETLKNIIISETRQQQYEALSTWVDFFASEGNKTTPIQFKEFIYNKLPTFGKYNNWNEEIEERNSASDPFPEYNAESVEKTYKLFNTIHRIQEKSKDVFFDKDWQREDLNKITTQKIKKTSDNMHGGSIVKGMLQDIKDIGAKITSSEADDILVFFFKEAEANGYKSDFSHYGHHYSISDEYEAKKTYVAELMKIVEEGDFKKAYNKYGGPRYSIKQKNYTEKLHPEIKPILNKKSKEHVEEKQYEEKGLDYYNYNTTAEGYAHRLDQLDTKEIARTKKEDQRARKIETALADLSVMLEKNGIQSRHIIQRIRKELGNQT